MARTLAVISTISSSPNPYYLLHLDSSETELRKNGFFGGFESLQELEKHCLELYQQTKEANVDTSMQGEEGYDLKSHAGYTTTSNGTIEVERSTSRLKSAAMLELATPPAKRLDDFVIYDGGGICVSIEQVPYEGDPIDEDFEKPRYYVATPVDGLVSEIHTWKVELEHIPCFLVKGPSSEWLELRKPADDFVEHFRCAFLVAHVLCFLKYKWPCPKEAALDYLRSHAKLDANENDLLQHHAVVDKILNGDAKLRSMLNVMKFLEIFGLAEGHGSGAMPQNEENNDNTSSVCAICDDGGDLVCCEGLCLRSFHFIPEPSCSSICLPDAKTAPFICLNCKYNQHQCFACGKLGFSNGAQKEVYKCSMQDCGCFYHLSCLPPSLLSRRDRGVFQCPLHRCVKCKGREQSENEPTKLIPCRRCPRAWHRRCVASKIRFINDIRPLDNPQEVRGWVFPTPFLYCLKHDLDPSLGAPPRNHIIFPNAA